MSGGKARRRDARARAVAALLDGEEFGITELEKLSVESVHAVEEPASGFPVLLMKRAAAANRDRDVLAAATDAIFARLGYQPRDLVTGGGHIRSRLVKSEAASSKRYTLLCAYPSWRADRLVAADGYKDFVSDDILETAAHEFLVKSPRVGLYHEPGHEDAGRVVESYIYRGPDPWKITAPDGSAQVIRKGDWLIGVVWDQPSFDLIRSGRLKGVSLQGSAIRRVPAPESLARLREREAA